MFTRFIEERSFVADGDMGLAFFDECTERLTCEESNIRLLEAETAHSSERTVLLLPLEPHTPGILLIKTGVSRKCAQKLLNVDNFIDKFILLGLERPFFFLNLSEK